MCDRPYGLALSFTLYMCVLTAVKQDSSSPAKRYGQATINVGEFSGRASKPGEGNLPIGQETHFLICSRPGSA